MQCKNPVICLFYCSRYLDSFIFKTSKNSVKLVVEYLGPEAEGVPSFGIQSHLPASGGDHCVFAHVGVVNCLRYLLLVVENDSLVLFLSP